MHGCATRTVRALAVCLGACGAFACAADPVGVTATPGARSAVSAPGAPWVDANGADHRARDAVRRAAQGASRPAPPAGDRARGGGDARSGGVGPSGDTRPSSDTRPSRDATPGGDATPGSNAIPGGDATARGDTPPGGDGAADAIRRRGERERDARRQRGSISPPPPATPRVQPDAPAAPPTRPPPRIAIPGPGEPGGPPIPLPSCGPAGCFDANGRPLPRVGGSDVLIGPGGRPCVQVGAMASC